jgi:arylsulfatase A-like enzyme
MDHQRMPDVSYVMRNDGGRCYFNGGYPEGGGTHGGLHPDELNNLLAVQGSLFKSGHVSDLAAGNIDVAPTILAALGLPRPVSMQGRVLAEGLADSDPEPPHAIATVRTVRRGLITQHLSYTELGGTRYLDRGWVE